MTLTMRWLAGATLALFSAIGSAASVWEGEFTTPSPMGKDRTVEWVFTIQCNDKDECTSRSAFMKDGKEVTPKDEKELTIKGPLKPDPMMTRALRQSARMVSGMDEVPTGPSYYDATIYPQIGSPDRVVECRVAAKQAVVICLLDRPLIDTGDRQLSEWVLLLPDYSSGSGCPGGGSVCPATLRKK